MMMLLAFDTLFFLSDAKANFENITARDILQKTLETVTSKPPMMADGEIRYKWDYSDRGIIEGKFVSRVYIRNQQHDTTRDSWMLKDGLRLPSEWYLRLSQCGVMQSLQELMLKECPKQLAVATTIV